MAVLIYESGHEKGRAVKLEAGHVYTLGRDPKAEVPLADELASRAHCKIAGKDGKFFLKDADSKNGTFVNDGKVAGVAELQSGDRITIGSTSFSFFSETDAGGGVGKQLGGYKLLQRLGRGGMGTVYRALQLSLNREVALKILAPKLSRDPAFVERFLKEARAAGQLNHPHIVQVYDAGKDGPLTFYAMEFMPGGTVEDRIVRGGPMKLEDALRFVHDAARGLEYAELKKIVHRDIKPDNLMLTELSSVKIADLGIAHATDAGAGATPDGGILGTPHFISPEQARGQALDTRSDLYSLGATFFRMLTGRTVFSGESAAEIVKKQVKETAPAVRDLRPDVPQPVSDIVAKLLEKDPANRFQSCAELITALDQYQGAAASSGKKLAAAALLVLVLGGAGVGAWAFLKKKEEPAPQPTVVVDDAEAKRRAAEMEAKLHQTQADLEHEQEASAALGELSVRLVSMPRDEQVKELRALADRFPGTNTAKNAITRAENLTAEIEADAKAAAEHETAVVAALAAWRAPVAAALDAKDFAGAARAIAAAPADVLKDETRLSDAKIELGTALAGALNGMAQAALSEANRAVEAGDAAAALATLDQLEPKLTELSGVAVASSDPGTSRLADQVKGLLASATDTRARATEIAARATAARLAGDLKIIGTGFDWNATFGHVRAHRFAEAAASLRDLRSRLATPEYQAWADRRVADAEAAAELRAAFVAAIQGKTLSDNKLKHPERDQTFEIAGLTDDGEGIVLEVSNRGGSARATVKFAQFDTVSRFIDLLHGRLAADPAIDLKIVRAALLIQSAQANAAARAVADALARWQPEAGWSEAESRTLKDVVWPRPDDPRLADLLARAESDASVGDAARAVRARMAREVDAAQLLARAFGPFQGKGELSFGGVVPLLARLLAEFKDTDVVLSAYATLDRGDASLSLVGPAQ